MSFENLNSCESLHEQFEICEHAACAIPLGMEHSLHESFCLSVLEEDRRRMVVCSLPAGAKVTKVKFAKMPCWA